MLDKLCISSEMLGGTQQELMNDPYVFMEIFNLSMSMEKPTTATPEALNPEKTIELVIASNKFM